MITVVSSVILIIIFLIYLFYSGNVYKILEGKSPNDLGTILCDSSFLTEKSNGALDDIWCAINFTTGEKRCPVNNEPIYADLNTELCSTKYRCDLQKLPFAVTADKSTNLQGNCDPGDECRCVAKPQCAENISSLFVLNTGNPYLPPDTQTLSFSQTNSYQTKLGNTVSRPLIYTDPTTQYCTINQELISAISPGTCYDNTDLPGCIKKNPCISGNLTQIGVNQVACISQDT